MAPVLKSECKVTLYKQPLALCGHSLMIPRMTVSDRFDCICTRFYGNPFLSNPAAQLSFQGSFLVVLNKLGS